MRENIMFFWGIEKKKDKAAWAAAVFDLPPEQPENLDENLLAKSTATLVSRQFRRTAFFIKFRDMPMDSKRENFRMKEKEEELGKVPEDTAETAPETVKSGTEETDAAEAGAETEDAEESVRAEDPEEPAPEESPAEKAEPVPEKAELEEVPEEEERKFTQKDVDRIVKKKLAQALPPKEEMEQFKKWRENQQTLEEKMSNLRVDNQRLREENENLVHENLVVKAGVDKDAVEFVLFKVSRMEGDFDENLESYLKKNPK